MIRTVLIPADFSDDCELVVRFSAGLARLGVTRALVAHVVDASGLEGAAIVARVDAARERMGALVAPLRDNRSESSWRWLPRHVSTPS
jgi:hypothetical protein